MRGEQPVEQRRARAADMQEAGGRGGEADDDAHACGDLAQQPRPSFVPSLRRAGAHGGFAAAIGGVRGRWLRSRHGRRRAICAARTRAAFWRGARRSCVRRRARALAALAAGADGRRHRRSISGSTREPPRWLGAALAWRLAGIALAGRMAARAHARVRGSVVFAVALGFAAAQFEAWLVAAPVLERRLGPVEIDGPARRRSILCPKGARLVIAPDRDRPISTPTHRRRGCACGCATAMRRRAGRWLRRAGGADAAAGAGDAGRLRFRARAPGSTAWARSAMRSARRSAIDPPAGEGVACWRIAIEALRTDGHAAHPRGAARASGRHRRGAHRRRHPRDPARRCRRVPRCRPRAYPRHRGAAYGHGGGRSSFFALRALFALIPRDRALSPDQEMRPRPARSA